MMRHTLTSLRPARAAIAAVLVLATSPAIAQDAVPLPPAEEPAPAAAPAPEIALPVLTPQAAPAPVIPTPSQSTEVVQATPAASPEDAAPAKPRAQARAQAPAVTRTAPVAPAPVAATPVVAPEPAAAPAPADAAPVMTPAVPAQPETVTPGYDGLYLAVGGGALLLLGGLGAYALSHRRKPLPTPLVTSPVQHTNLNFEPVEVVPEPIAVSAATATPRAATATSWSPLEEMVSAKPSPENPFLTRKARLRRANYILAKGIPEPLTGDAQPAHERAEEKQFKPQQAYNFGKAQNPPRFTWKPATS